MCLFAVRKRLSAILDVETSIRSGLLCPTMSGGDDESDPNKRAAAARAGSPYLNTAQAAHYLGISERTLEDMRASASGPTFRKHGTSIRYHILDLDTWSDSRKRTSTHSPPTTR